MVLALQQEIQDTNAKSQRLTTENQHYQNKMKELKQQSDLTQANLSQALDSIEALRQTVEQSNNKEAQLIVNIEQLQATIAQRQTSNGDQDHEHPGQD